MKTVVITGAEGKLGRYVVKEFAEHGYRVFGTDMRPPSGGRGYSRYMQADLGSLGEVYGLLADADSVVHLAAVPNPINFSPERIFSNNVMSTYNVLEAASKLGINKAVIGSSESAYGFCWAKTPFAPDFFPVDETHPLLAQESYGLSKGVNEQIGDMFYRRVGMSVYALRFSHVLEPDEYEHVIAGFEHTGRHHRILWSYIDARDAAEACRLAVESEKPAESVALNITASDMMSDASPELLLNRHYAQVKDIRKPVSELTALVSNKLAEDKIGWKPRHSWREALK
ncbi:NAD-dependent epimerase/dehydratase family protein [Paenibacillus sp. NPDC058174]|uniref:NAD-dependent epimerase/dehydratase family protein n=1 Tax=Paenibacillus sp. NPDC058174 TaxID=3346366 RepID=UPI0036DDDB3A